MVGRKRTKSLSVVIKVFSLISLTQKTGDCRIFWDLNVRAFLVIEDTCSGGYCNYLGIEVIMPELPNIQI